MNHASPHTARHVHEHGHEHDSGDHSEILDLDADVLAEHIASITAWLPVGSGPRHIVDLGCGTGAGSLALLDRFPGAEVTAVDVSAAHLHRLQEKAAGAAGRLRIVRADLDATVWPDLGAPELVWASASMHHMSEPDRALRQVHDLLAPGGLFAVVELAGFPGSCPQAPRKRPLALRNAAIPHSTSTTPSKYPTAARTGEPS